MPNHNCRQKWQVTQMLASATSQWGLGREVQAASTVLRVRTRPQWPVENLRELIWDSDSNSGIARETKNTFPVKGSNATRCLLACSQNKGLSNYQRRANRLPYKCPLAPEAEGRCAPARAKGTLAAILAPETASSTKLWAGSQLLTISSWDPG